MDQVTLCSPALRQEIGNLGSFRGERSPPSGSPPNPLSLAWDQIGWIRLNKSLLNTYNNIQCQILKLGTGRNMLPPALGEQMLGWGGRWTINTK